MPNVAKCTVISVVTHRGMHNINYVGFCKQQNARISDASLRISATLWPNVEAGTRFELPDHPRTTHVVVDGITIRPPKQTSPSLQHATT
jgi:hypothetical protein